MMSKDRVVFTIPHCAFKDYKMGYTTALNRAFGDPKNTDGWERLLGEGYDLTIRCRPSQFARFLIHRDGLRVPNSFKALDAKLEQEIQDTVMDVSKRPNRFWDD